MFFRVDAISVKFQLRGRTLNFYPPSNFVEAANSGDAPDKKLQLEWVYPSFKMYFNIAQS